MADLGRFHDVFRDTLATLILEEAAAHRPVVDGGVEKGISAGIASSLGPIMEVLKERPSAGSKNFGFSKTAVPTFNDDIRDFSK